MPKSNELKLKLPLLTALLLFCIPVYAIDNITVLGLFKDKAIVKIDGKQRLLTKDQVSPEGVILISANSREAVVEINGEQQTLTLGTHIASEFKPTAEKKVVTVAPDSKGMYFVNGSINGFQVDFVVDTGATVISMNKHEAKRMGLNYKLEGTKSVSYTASGLDTIYVMNLKKVKVGDIEIRDVQAAIHDGDHPAVVLLGNSFLSSLDMQREGRILKLIK